MKNEWNTLKAKQQIIVEIFGENEICLKEGDLVVATESKIKEAARICRNKVVNVLCVC